MADAVWWLEAVKPAGWTELGDGTELLSRGVSEPFVCARIDNLDFVDPSVQGTGNSVATAETAGKKLMEVFRAVGAYPRFVGDQIRFSATDAAALFASEVECPHQFMAAVRLWIHDKLQVDRHRATI